MLSMKERFDSPAFQEAYHCDVPLGAFCGARGTVFRLWAPTAQDVILRLYREGTGGGPLEQIPLHPEKRGCGLTSLRRTWTGSLTTIWSPWTGRPGPRQTPTPVPAASTASGA